MAGRISAKPYCKAVSNYPRHKEEIDHLPPKYWEILSRYPYIKGTYSADEEDFFENLILYCLEADNSKTVSFHNIALQIVETHLRKQRRETEKLYNPYRNLCLDKCYGDSKTPLGEWMNFFPDEED